MKISRREKREERRSRRSLPTEVLNNPIEEPRLQPLRALTDNQDRYINCIENNTLTFATGPAGTGKTYIAACIAAEMLLAGDIERLVVTRPGVEAGEKFGFLPGELSEKYAPYIEPFLDVLNKKLGRSYVANLMKLGRIVAKPLAFMRGSTFDKSLVILDEAQNCTPVQMKLFLTRIGNNSKVIVDGDISQKDIPGVSGLSDALYRLHGVPSVGFVQFSMDDCVRSGLCRRILEVYSS